MTGFVPTQTSFQWCLTKERLDNVMKYHKDDQYPEMREESQIKQKFVIEVEEMCPHYEDEKLIGWDTVRHKLLFFGSETEAEEVEVELAESQDCDRKVVIKRIGWVEVPSCFPELDDANEDFHKVMPEFCREMRFGN